VAQIEAGWNATGHAQLLKNMADAYGNKTFIAHYNDEAQAGVGTGTSAWQLFLSNPGALNSIQTNHQEQVMAYQAFVNVSKNAGVKGVTIGEYDPWYVTSGPGYQQMARLGVDLWSSPVSGQIAATLNAL
jgi:hypothetical protein